jgi:hypothetical protein
MLSGPVLMVVLGSGGAISMVFLTCCWIVNRGLLLNEGCANTFWNRKISCMLFSCCASNKNKKTKKNKKIENGRKKEEHFDL